MNITTYLVIVANSWIKNWFAGLLVQTFDFFGRCCNIFLRQWQRSHMFPYRNITFFRKIQKNLIHSFARRLRQKRLEIQNIKKFEILCYSNIVKVNDVEQISSNGVITRRTLSYLVVYLISCFNLLTHLIFFWAMFLPTHNRRSISFFQQLNSHNETDVRLVGCLEFV